MTTSGSRRVSADPSAPPAPGADASGAAGRPPRPHRRRQDGIALVLAAILLTLTVIAIATRAPLRRPQPTPSAGAALAFPGAVGYGQATVGGRGGRVIAVTSLADSGAGSLREALGASGPRTVVFRVAGTIDLRSDIPITNPNVTIAGQSAPGGGIVLRGATIHVRAAQVIVRHVRFRPGDTVTATPADQDGFTINGSGVDHVVLDHVEAIWGPDMGGLAILNDARDVTVMESILGEGLFRSRHPEAVARQGGHALGVNVANTNGATPYPQRITLYRNLLATSEARNPQLQGVTCADVINNVIYDFGTDSAHGNPRAANIVGNTFRSGPETSRFTWWRARASSENPSYFPDSVYFAGNVADGFTPSESFAPGTRANSPTCPYSVTPGPAPSVADLVATVGPRPVDSVTRRWLDEAMERTGTYFNGTGKRGPNPWWPTVDAGTPPADADGDGMADGWEVSHFGSTSRGSASDSRSDDDGDGYTDLEEYLDGTDPTSGAVPGPGHS